MNPPAPAARGIDARHAARKRGLHRTCCPRCGCILILEFRLVGLVLQELCPLLLQVDGLHTGAQAARLVSNAYYTQQPEDLRLQSDIFWRRTGIATGGVIRSALCSAALELP